MIQNHESILTNLEMLDFQLGNIGFHCFAVHAVAALEQENILRRGSDSSSSVGIAVNIKDIGTLEQGKGCVGNPLLAFTIAVDKHLVERSIQGVAGDAVLAFRIKAVLVLFRDAAAEENAGSSVGPQVIRRKLSVGSVTGQFGLGNSAQVISGFHSFIGVDDEFFLRRVEYGSGRILQVRQRVCEGVRV